MEHNAYKRNSSRQTDLMNVCKTGNVAVVREILKWRDVDGKRVDISARDENGQTALSFAKQSNNAEIVAMIEQNLFLRAVEKGDTETVKTYLSTKESNFEVLCRPSDIDGLAKHHEHNSEQMKIQSCKAGLTEETPPSRFKVRFEEHFTSKDSITKSVWLEAVDIAQRKCNDEMLNLLFHDDRFFDGSNYDGQTILHQLVAEYLADYYESRKLVAFEFFLKSRKLNANVLNLKNETIFDIVCKIEPRYCSQIDKLLLTFFQNGINLNVTNKNGETLLILACKNKRIDIVRSLLELDSSHEFVLDIDAVDNSGETALMKAKGNNDTKIVAALLEKTLMSAYAKEKEDAMLKNDQFILGVIEDGLTNFYEVVTEYLKFNYNYGNMKPIEILLKYWKFNANVLNSKNEVILEAICKMKLSSHSVMDDLLKILHQNEIDLNGRNKNGETLLMFACKNNLIEMVRSLIKMASREFVLDIDAVDNLGETALMKAKERNFSIVVVLLLGFQLISAVKLENADIVKSTLVEFRNTLDIFVKSWSSKTYLNRPNILIEWERKSAIFLKAMYIAMKSDTKHSEEIVKLLLDCDILLSQEISFYQLMHEWEVDDDKKLCLIELLLKSGKINVNDRNQNGGTALHLTREEKLTSLFIRYGADVNRKDKDGRTPLMPISDDWVLDGSISVLRILLEEAGTLMNLDAVDCNGRTALMYAAMWRRSHDVQLLLNKGASVNLSDHLGLTALHYALYGDIRGDAEFWRNSEELKIIKETSVLLDTEKHLLRASTNDWSKTRREIIEILLQRPDIVVNLCTCNIEMFSPLDIAEGQISETPSSIRNALKEKGAVLNVFRKTELQSSSDFHLDFTRKLTLDLMQIIETLQNADTNFEYDLFKERWLTSIETFIEERVSDKDTQGRTALHLFAISSFGLLHDNYGGRRRDLGNAVVDKLISLGCSVNERDIFERTPLHYANPVLWELLTSKGADASIKDKDGNIAIDLMSSNFSLETYYRPILCERNDETYLLRLMNNKQMEMSVQGVDKPNNGDSDDNCIPENKETEYVPSLLWEKGEYAFRHPLFETLAKEVRDLMDAIAKEIERLDPRFKIKPILVGSSNEGTKLDKPNEFDFCFVLTKISELCEVSQSPELAPGFAHLKRNSIKVGEASDFDSFFGKTGILNTVKLTWQFATILRNTLVNVERQQRFEWILKTMKYPRIYEDITKVLNIKMFKPLNFFTVDTISVDIVPCIHVDGWWPDEAIFNVTDEIKKLGCNLVFESPQKLYPWVPYSESCARISFAKAESDMIKKSCANAKEAYMIGKKMTENKYVSKYILKNCLLYCIEALSPSSEKAFNLSLTLEEMKSKFEQMDRYLWLKCILKCHLEFVAQDFCPCYFLPTFCNCSIITEEQHSRYLKKVSFDWIADWLSEFPEACKRACELYRIASNDISESSYQLPAPDPLWERFDRKQLIASLCEMAYK